MRPDAVRLLRTLHIIQIRGGCFQFLTSESSDLMTAWRFPPSKIYWHFPALGPSSVITLPLKGLHGLFFLNKLMSAGFSSPHLRSPGVFIIQRACTSWSAPFVDSLHLSELAQKTKKVICWWELIPLRTLSLMSAPVHPSSFFSIKSTQRSGIHIVVLPPRPNASKNIFGKQKGPKKKNLEPSSQRPHCPGGLIVSSSPARDETDGSPACSFHSSCFLGSSPAERILSCPAGRREWKRENVRGWHKLFTKAFQAHSGFIEKASVFPTFDLNELRWWLQVLFFCFWNAASVKRFLRKCDWVSAKQDVLVSKSNTGSSSSSWLHINCWLFDDRSV